VLTRREERVYVNLEAEKGYREFNLGAFSYVHVYNF
jgi:hypothetical protein